MMGWMAPLRHLSAKLLVIESAATGSHPWVRLGQLDWTWRSNHRHASDRSSIGSKAGDITHTDRVRAGGRPGWQWPRR
jgi:hypothetical protein